MKGGARHQQGTGKVTFGWRELWRRNHDEYGGSRGKRHEDTREPAAGGLEQRTAASGDDAGY